MKSSVYKYVRMLGLFSVCYSCRHWYRTNDLFCLLCACFVCHVSISKGVFLVKMKNSFVPIVLTHCVNAYLKILLSHEEVSIVIEQAREWSEQVKPV